ncbi:MAG: ComEC family competence protein, partial [Candidatus Omnitrophica bacterium]|nr:ComEC family competence protein [Candidatus Omnitrophota bacterium]
MEIKFLKERFLFLPVFCIFFCLGICTLNYIKISFIFLYIITLITLILNFIFIKRPISIIFFYPLGFLLGCLLFLNSQIKPPNHLKNLRIPSGALIKIKGTVSSFPKITEKYTEFVFLIEAMIGDDKIYPVKGKLLVKISKKDSIFWGENLILEGKYYRPFYNYYKSYLKQKQIYAILKVNEYHRIIHLEKKGISFSKFSLHKLREKIKTLLNRRVSCFSAAILDAVILGDRSRLSFDIKDSFLKTGTVHILAISGLHIGIVGFISLLIFKILRIPRRVRYILTIFILIFYCI